MKKILGLLFALFCLMLSVPLAAANPVPMSFYPIDVMGRNVFMTVMALSFLTFAVAYLVKKKLIPKRIALTAGH